MDDDRSWLKNPIIPRPPGVPRFSSAELRLVNDERLSSAMRAAPREERLRRRPLARVSGTTTAEAAVPENDAEGERCSA